ncbi:MAG: hypothetical protein COA53_10000 [Rhodobacteraceae bacterium]|nr:MAG: hypothetical protein COA53_10000 [Paracoccaceae bacterium]
MSGRKFSIMSCNKFEDDSWDRLSSSDVRMVLMAVFHSRQNNPIGIFCYPEEIWSRQARVTLDSLRVAIIELEAANLLEYDHQDKSVRVAGWFLNKPPSNPKEASGIISIFREKMDLPPMMVRQIAEFCAVLAVKLKRWSEKESKDFQALVVRLKVFMLEVDEDTEYGLSNCIEEQLTQLPKSYQNAMKSLGFKYALPYPDAALSNNLQPSQNKPLDTVSKQREEKKEKESNKKEKPDTSANHSQLGAPMISQNSGTMKAPSSVTKGSRLAKLAKGDVERHSR